MAINVNAVPTVTINGEQLKKLVDLGKSIVPKKSSVPVLECVKLSIQANQAVFSVTDCDQFAELTFSTESLAGEALIPFQHLKSFKITKKDNIKIEIHPGRVIMNGFSYATTGDIAMFPQFTFKHDAPVDVNPDYFMYLAAAVPFCSDSYTQQVLTGIFHTNGKLVGCDRHELIEIDRAHKIPGTFILPAKTAAIFGKTLKGRFASVQVDDYNYYLKSDELRFTSRIIDGSYPAYDRIFPPATISMPIMTDEWLRLHEQLGKVPRTEKGDRFLIAKWRENGNSSFMVGRDNIGQVDFAFKAAEDIDIAYNNDYMINALRAFKAAGLDSVELGYTGKLQPLVLSYGVVRCLVLPFRIA